MCDNEKVEQSSLANRPWLVVALRIVSVEVRDSCHVNQGDCERYIDIQERIVDVGGDAERVRKCWIVGGRR